MKYYAINSYVVLKGKRGEKDYLISKSIYNEDQDEEGEIDLLKIKRLACREDLFEIIHLHHMLWQHGGAQNTWMTSLQLLSLITLVGFSLPQ
jgi:hypothetical protein